VKVLKLHHFHAVPTLVKKCVVQAPAQYVPEPYRISQDSVSVNKFFYTGTSIPKHTGIKNYLHKYFFFDSYLCTVLNQNDLAPCGSGSVTLVEVV
jgi:hypothetical protein